MGPVYNLRGDHKNDNAFNLAAVLGVHVDACDP